ncbi:MAG: hypothetical protein AAF266_05015 [Planctomycetota bacterium]
MPAWVFYIVILGLPAALLCLAVLNDVLAMTSGSARFEGFARKAKTLGRHLDLDAVKQRLYLGEGTLLIETVEPWGLHRYWWTADDVLGTAPVQLATACEKSNSESEDTVLEFARLCVSKYVALDTGHAGLVDFDTPIDEIARVYPKARALSLYTLGDHSPTAHPTIHAISKESH